MVVLGDFFDLFFWVPFFDLGFGVVYFLVARIPVLPNVAMSPTFFSRKS